MGLLELAAEPEIYFTTNWTDTDIELPDTEFDYDGLDTYISIDFAPTVNDYTGMDGTSTGRIASYGLYSVYCYHKKLKLALDLADDIKTFFNGIELPKDIHVGIGQDKPAIDLENGFFESKVNFELKQYS